MRSILSQYEYIYQVCKFDNEGIPFRTHLYVPEIHPVSQMPFCEREDEAHVLKVSKTNTTRRHIQPIMQMCNFSEDC